MGTAIIAASAGLAGVLLQALITDARARATQHRRDLADALLSVLNAAVHLRNRHYLKHTARANGQDDTQDTRTDRYDARTTLTGALDALHITTRNPVLLEAAQEVFDSSVALGDARGEDAISQAGLRARQAHTALRVAANGALFR